ncbi:holliday junction resolvase RecU [Peptococcaceae bacterium CEB3]|nr:holliday junction resolvase RecU [Peptococcaceae bacterium CEB3]
MPSVKANLGMILEQQIFLACDWYAARGYALIQKIPTPWEPERRDGRIIGAHPAKKSTIDFLGALAPHGQAIALEAKEEQTAAIRKSRVKPHQVKFLKTLAACGGAAYIVVGFYNANRFFLVPAPLWGDWPNPIFTVQDCARFGTEIFLWDENRRLDFLGVASCPNVK